MPLVHPTTFQILKIFRGLYLRTPFAGAHPTPIVSHARPPFPAVRPRASVPIVAILYEMTTDAEATQKFFWYAFLSRISVC